MTIEGTKRRPRNKSRATEQSMTRDGTIAMEQIRTMKKEQKISISKTNHDYRGNKEGHGTNQHQRNKTGTREGRIN
jgi:hypothetical protein